MSNLSFPTKNLSMTSCYFILLELCSILPFSTSVIFEAFKLVWTDSASLGAALRAAHGLLCNKNGSFVPISDMYKSKLDKTSLGCKLAVGAGDKELITKYGFVMKKRMEIENHLVQKLGRF